MMYKPVYPVEPVFMRRAGDENSIACPIRLDDAGFWNFWKAWYIYLLHLGAAIGFMVGIFNIDNLNFRIGSGPNLLYFEKSALLYQAQATALISVGLAIVRVIAASGSALLGWRIIYILLEKRGISLVEMYQLVNWRIPVRPGKENSRKSLLWSLWAIVTIAFLWPQGFAAPLASSSVTWIPRMRALDTVRSARVPTVGEFSDWPALMYSEDLYGIVVAAAAMTNQEPAYAFEQSKIPLRRHFQNASISIPDGSSIDALMPYFDVNLRWVDGSTHSEAYNVGDSVYQDVNKDYSIRVNGATAFVRSEPWEAVPAFPGKAAIFTGTRIVGIKVRTIDINSTLPDGTIVREGTSCPRVTTEFGELPDVEQLQLSYGIPGDMLAYDCFIFAEATITAAKTQAKGCNVTLPGRSEELYATCFLPRDTVVLEADWLTHLALDFRSEVLKYTVAQNYTRPWINGNLTEYTTGILTLGYHAAWSALTKRLANASEEVTFRPSEQVVFASIEKTNLYIWLALHATLTLSALLVLLANSLSDTKTMRDSTLAALTMDLTEIMCTSRARGLCNAAALNKGDRELPLLKWKGSGREYHSGEKDCHRRVVFVKEDEVDTPMISYAGRMG